MNHPFWSHGFRPFFLLGALFAALALPLWIIAMRGIVQLPVAGGPLAWHSHEMLFGFAGAAIAGFLTTAVPNWTGAHPIAGAPLMGLTLLWIGGRAAWLFSGDLPLWLVAAVDVAFLPLLAVPLGLSILRERQWRNVPVILVILTIAGANLMTHLQFSGDLPGGLRLGNYLALYAIATLIAIIGGRIVPAFTRNALRQRGDETPVVSRRPLDIAAIAGVAATGVAFVIDGTSAVTGALAGAAAVLNLVRLTGWAGHRTLASPILWVLHIAYLWLPVSLALLALAAWLPTVPPTASLHALGAGAVATMILAVTTRASLGHTGRPLVAPPLVAAAYSLVTAAAVIRTVAALSPAAGPVLLIAAAACWCAAFALFTLVYGPMMMRPRVDAAAGSA